MEAPLYEIDITPNQSQAQKIQSKTGELRIKLEYIDNNGTHEPIHKYCGIIDQRISVPSINLKSRKRTESIYLDLNSENNRRIPKSIKLKLLQVGVEKLIESYNQLDNRFLDKKKTLPDGSSSSSSDKKFLNEILNLLEDNISDEAYCVEDLSSDMNSSRSTFFRRLKKVTGQAPKDFMRTVRLKKAVQLLEEGQLRIAEVAYKVGFSDPNYFSKCFRKHFGQSPSDYLMSRG